MLSNGVLVLDIKTKSLECAAMRTETDQGRIESCNVPRPPLDSEQPPLDSCHPLHLDILSAKGSTHVPFSLLVDGVDAVGYCVGPEGPGSSGLDFPLTGAAR